MSYHGAKVWKNVNMSKGNVWKNNEIAKKSGDSAILIKSSEDTSLTQLVLPIRTY